MSYTITPVAVHENKDHPDNTTGETFVDTVNGLVELLGGDVNRKDIPALNPNVQTHTFYDRTKSYSFGDEVRGAYGYFRCIAPFDATLEDHNLDDSNYWLLFYLPATASYAFAGLYEPFKGYPRDVTVAKIIAQQIKVYRTNKKITSEDDNFEVDFTLIGTYNL